MQIHGFLGVTSWMQIALYFWLSSIQQRTSGRTSFNSSQGGLINICDPSDLHTVSSRNGYLHKGAYAIDRRSHTWPGRGMSTSTSLDHVLST
jgi:hypothetical protein